MKQKKRNIRFWLLGIVISGYFSACSPHIVTNMSKIYPALDAAVEVKVIEVGESIPLKYEELGSVRLEDAGMTGKSKCTYEALLAFAIEEAKKVGGNAIKVVEHIPPHWGKGGVGSRPGVSVGVGVTYNQCHSLFVLILKTDEN